MYQHIERITDSIRRRRINFYGHITRMDSERVTNRICTYFVNKKTKEPWFTEVEKDLWEIGITHADVLLYWGNLVHTFGSKRSQSWKPARNGLRERGPQKPNEITEQELKLDTVGLMWSTAGRNEQKKNKYKLVYQISVNHYSRSL